MAKVQFNDVVPPDRRSIRNIPISHSPQKQASAFVDQKIVNKIVNTEPEIKQPKQDFKDPTITPTPKPFTQNYYFEEKDYKKTNKKIVYIGGIVVAVLAFIVFMMTLFSSANITITPKSDILSISQELELAPDNTNPNVMKYEILKLEKQSAISVPAKNEEMVEKRSSGKITIYNNFSTEKQRLITRTRFETPEGLIYRIAESIVVPGKTTKDGESIPGSIEVEVFADEAGEKYNIGKTDFKIPGFKTDKARYDNFYARSVTEMSGGFVGKMKTITKEDHDQNLNDLTLKIQADIEKEMSTKIPDELVLLQNGITFHKKELPQKEDGSNVLISQEVTAYAILLPRADLSNLISSQKSKISSDWSDINAFTPDFGNLKITSKPENIAAGTTIKIKIEGTANIEALIDEDILKTKLAGTKKKEMDSVLGQFPSIMNVKAAVRPMWVKSFPDNPAKIYINLKKS